MSEQQQSSGVQSASEILKSSHPLHGTFINWLEERVGSPKPSKRQARKFLQAHPFYRGSKAA